MRRRSLVQAVLAIASAALLSGNSSFRYPNAQPAQHWLIGAARDDAEASRLADAASALLAARLPESQAMPIEAASERDIVHLLRIRQLELAILSIDAANEALSGSVNPFREAPVRLRTVVPFGPHLLVALEDYPTDKAARIAAALAGFRWKDGSAPTRRSGPQSMVPLHAGAIRFKQAHEPQSGQ